MIESGHYDVVIGEITDKILAHMLLTTTGLANALLSITVSTPVAHVLNGA